eukprot:TRINITY_DN3167_c0_g1_i2.p1 TRINITY_DN3167_c0_g1~~TRINITY_DN3167_c0_g1_i2.p1  ORF type:complete len:671 (+),score=128.82 TRINITY_DN3167_c0_g1_i2:249-2015(+)
MVAEIIHPMLKSKLRTYWKSLKEREESGFSQISNLPLHHVEPHFTVNGGIKDPESYYYVVPNNEQLLKAVFQREYVMLQGHRGSGKSTRLHALAPQIEKNGIVWIYISFQGGISYQSPSSFWDGLGRKLSVAAKAILGHGQIRNEYQFRMLFYNAKVPICLCIDEFDAILPYNEARDSFLATLRDMKPERGKGDNFQYLWSVIIAGPMSILLAGSSTISTSPFNITQAIANPYFTEEEVEKLFHPLRNLICTDIVADIFQRTKGHPGYTCWCGKKITEDLMRGKDRITPSEWIEWANFNLAESVTNWATAGQLKRIVAQARYSDFLWHHFLYQGDVKVWFQGNTELSLARELVAEGVLTALPRDGDQLSRGFMMASDLVCDIVIRSILPQRDIRCPSTWDWDNLDIPTVFQILLPAFSSAVMRQAPTMASKKDEKDGQTRVPAETVYEMELLAALQSFLPTLGGWEIAQQNNVENKRRDIFLKRTDADGVCSEWVFELCAHCRDGPAERPTSVEGHFRRCAEHYKIGKFVKEAWVINFTTRMPTNKHMYVWPNPDLGIHALHIQHDLKWTVANLYWNNGESHLEVQLE